LESPAKGLDVFPVIKVSL